MSRKQWSRCLVNGFLFLAIAGAAGAQPLFSKAFQPDTIGPGSTSVLTFQLVNESEVAVVDMAFTDTLPAGVSLATPAGLVSTCGGTVTAPNGGTTITLTDGSLGSLGSCTVKVNVISASVGTHTNTSGDLTSSAGNSGSATDDLEVVTTRPGFTKFFSPSSAPLGTRGTLHFTIDNIANDSDVVALNFSDNLPAGMVIASPANASTTCGTAQIPPTLNATEGTAFIQLDAGGIGSFPALEAGGSCTAAVDVVTTGSGLLENVTGELMETVGSTLVSAGRASAVFTSTITPLALIKEFVNDPVPPGGTVDLRFTITNTDRVNDATGITFSDDLSASLTGLAAIAPLPATPCGSGSSLSGITTLTLTGGTLAAEGSCTFTVTLQVPPAASSGIYPNTTSAITGNVGSPVVGNMASDNLFVDAVPLLTKTFLDDPVGTGDSTRIEFTITNSSTTAPASDIAFIDDLTDFLPFPVTATLPADGFCGIGSSMVLGDFGTQRQGLSMTGGDLLPSGSCTFIVTVDVPPGMISGIYTNTTEVITATVEGTTVTGRPATDSLTVVGGPRLSKQFTNDPAAPGGTVTLQFELRHGAEAPGAATDITFTDDLSAAGPPGLAATGLPLNNVCGTGSQISGTTTLTLTGGALNPGESCQFSVTLQVPGGALPGEYTNTTSEVTSTVSGLTTSSAAASDDLLVSGLVFSKEFTDDPVIPGGIVTLAFNLTNAAGAPAASSISFQDNLDATLAGLTVEPTSVPLNPCGVGSLITLSAGDSVLTFSGGSLAAGPSNCAFSVTLNVPGGAASNTYLNRTQGFEADFGAGPVTLPNATDNLVVAGNLLALSKTFLTNPVAPGATVGLEFTLTNLSPSEAATAIAFTDDLDAALTGLTATGLPSTACGGIVAALPDAGTIDFSGGSLAAGATCTFTVTLQVPASPAASSGVNVTSPVSGTIGGLAVTGDPASDTLRLVSAGFTKSFDAPTGAGGTAVLTFTINNLTANPLNGLGFIDDLEATLPGLVATGLPVTGVCGSESSLTGTSVLTFSAGSLAGNASCSFGVTVQVPSAAAPGSYSNTTSDLFDNGLTVGGPATATLVIEPPPGFAKVFAPASIAVGATSTLTFTIDNSASVAATSLDFTDNLPAGVEVANPNGASTTCTAGTLTAPIGAGTISYTGGSVGPSSSCTVSVDVSSAAAGSYVNTTGDLTSSLGNSGTATDTLTVNPPPGFAKVFAPASIAVGATSTLTFTIDNSASVAATSLDFTDNLPAGVEVANPNGASTTCTAGTLTAPIGAGTISYTGGSVGPSSSCTVSVDVSSAAAGSYVNTTGDLTSSLGNSGTATDTLTVNPPPTFAKAFNPTVVDLGEVSTLTFTIDNTASSEAATSLAFVDTMPAGMEVANPANIVNDCGGTVTAVPGASSISLSGGTVAAGGVCTISVDVLSNSAGANVNTATLSSSQGPSAAAASGTLTVNAAMTIPTMSEWMLLLFSLLLVGAAMRRIGMA